MENDTDRIIEADYGDENSIFDSGLHEPEVASCRSSPERSAPSFYIGDNPATFSEGTGASTVIHSTSITNHGTVNVIQSSGPGQHSHNHAGRDGETPTHFATATHEEQISEFDRCVAELKKRSRRDQKMIHPVTWLEDVSLELLHLYVPHTIRDVTNNRYYSGILEVFETTQSALPRRLVIRGETGSGRRLLASYLSLVWATDEDNSSAISLFRCVIVLREENLRSGCSIKDEVLNILSHGVPGVDRARLWSEFVENSEDVLLVISGYDKVKDRQSDIDKFLLDGELANACMLVTCSSHRAPDLPAVCSKRIMSLEMFTPDSAKQCIKNYYRCRHEDDDASNELLEWVATRPEIGELALWPLYNAMLCIMFDKQLSSASTSTLAITGVIVNRVLDSVMDIQSDHGRRMRNSLEKLAFDSITNMEGTFTQEEMENVLHDSVYLSLSMRSGLFIKRNSIMDLKQVSTYAFEMNPTRYYLAVAFIARNGSRIFEDALKRSTNRAPLKRIISDSFKLVEPTQAGSKMKCLMRFWEKRIQKCEGDPDEYLTMCATAWTLLKENDKFSNSNMKDSLHTTLAATCSAALPNKVHLTLNNESSESDNTENDVEEQIKRFLFALLRHEGSSCVHLNLTLLGELTPADLDDLDAILKGKGSPKKLLITSPTSNYDVIRALLQEARTTHVVLYFVGHRHWSFSGRQQENEFKEQILTVTLRVVETTMHVRHLYVAVDRPLEYAEKDLLRTVDASIKRNKSLQKLHLAVHNKELRTRSITACGTLKNVDFCVGSGQCNLEGKLYITSKRSCFC